MTIFFLPLVIIFDYYYISNYKIFMCGNNSEYPFIIHWYGAQSVSFKKMHIFNEKYQFYFCPEISYCQYEEMIADKEYSLHTTHLFVINCPIVKEDLERFHEIIQKIIDKYQTIVFTFEFFYNFLYLLLYYKKILP